MAQSRVGSTIPRRRLLVLLVGFLLVACDVGPIQDNADLPSPVETVTAVEIDVDDLIVDAPSPSTDRSPYATAQRPR
jgi:hypothetical protein